MILFPAIDLIGGKVVRLAKGDRAHMDVYSEDPAGTAASFQSAGATWIHVVDLSRAFGEDEEALRANREALAAICQVPGISVDAGGGIRSLKDIEELIGLGVRRIALGTALVKDPGFAQEAAREFGAYVVADVAAKGGAVKVNGWRDGAEVSADELVSHLAGLGFRHLVFTDISRDGMQTGIDAAAYRHIASVAGFPVVASGGIASLDDLRTLSALGTETVEGAIVGRALYEGAFSLEEALAAARGEERECSPNA